MVHSEVGQSATMKYENRILLIAAIAPLPGALVALLLLWGGDYVAETQWTLSILILMLWWGLVLALHRRVVFPLRTLSNMLAALREGDYSLRARGAHHKGALGEVMLEANALGQTLREQRLGALEATGLLRKVMAEIDVAVFAFDGEQRLRLVNQCGERLLGKPPERLLGQRAAEVGLAECLEGDVPRIIDVAFAGGTGRWELRRSAFREGGLPHQLLVLSDLTRTLRQEERQAWRRVVQVLRHEVNNSLAPIQSLAESLANLLAREPRPRDWEQDLGEGLGVIADRSKSLNRFMASYARLTRLPKPRPRPVNVEEWVRHVAGLESRMKVEVMPGPDLTIQADGDQLDQLLINLIGNAVDAALETGGKVQVGWKMPSKESGYLELCVDDEGPGLSNPANLFVPFYTTKPDGSGIGLVLSRQIAEVHGGSLALKDRPGGHGCRAHLRLPVV